MARLPITRMSYGEYLALEDRSEEKHEYLRGQIFAMSGGSPAHSLLAARIIRALGNALDGGPCEPFTSDLRIRVEETDIATYPDVTVICGPVTTSERDVRAAINPTLIVEVLSDATETYDRGAKFGHYRRIQSLREYVLVSQNEPLIEVYRRNAENKWQLESETQSGVVALGSLGVSIDCDALYRELPPAAI